MHKDSLKLVKKRLLYKCTNVYLIFRLSSGTSVAAASCRGLPLQQDFQGQPLVCEYGKKYGM